MALSDEHKAALAKGRKEARAVSAYLKTLGSSKPGRPVTKDSLQSRLDNTNSKLESEKNPLTKVDLLQKKLDLEQELAGLSEAVDVSDLEAAFVKHAKSYSERKGITYTAWRSAGVPAATLRTAGIKETRRR